MDKPTTPPAANDRSPFLFPGWEPKAKGWFTWSAVLLGIIALLYIIFAVVLPIGAGVSMGSPGLVVGGAFGFVAWFLFSGILFYTANTCRKHYKGDYTWSQTPV